MKNNYWKFIKPRLWIFILIAVSFAVYRLAFLFPSVTEEVYSRAVYPFLANIFSKISGILPVSIAEFGLYIFAVYIVFSVFFILFGFVHKGKRFYLFFTRLISFLCVLCVLGSSFIINWGINYAREPLKKTMNMETDKYTAEELKAVSLLLAEKANSLRSLCNEDENGVFTLSSTREDVLKDVPELYKECAPDYLNLVSSKAPCKGVLKNDFLSSFETTGIYSPFTFEANVNMQMPESFFASTAVHEYAHLQGYAREDEANFICWYVGRNSKNADFAYSSYILALTYATNSLYGANQEYYDEVYSKISPAVKRDFSANNRYWDKFDTEFSEKANDVYSDYLKSSGIQDGNKSYGRMLDLILALYRKGEEI